VFVRLTKTVKGLAILSFYNGANFSESEYMCSENEYEARKLNRNQQSSPNSSRWLGHLVSLALFDKDNNTQQTPPPRT
jgi:hypothetical protein